MDNNLPKVKKTFYSIYIKRWFDVTISSFGILVLTPVFLVVCVLELVFHGRPIIYNTKRPGKDGKIFNMYKFRSMTNECDNAGRLLPNEKRLTKFGHFLRKTSIDELPGLFNILKGDMSIVGPRALRIEYLKYYNERHAMRHAVRPGLALYCITDNGDVTWTWREQFENDVWYVENISFLVDLRMIYEIFKQVLKASEHRASAERAPFNGSNLDDVKSALYKKNKS